MSPQRPERRYFNRGLLGAIGTAVALLYLQGCSAPAVQPWHSEELSAEFTAHKLDQVASFEDYLRLEDELFVQLEQQVYAEVPTGPEYALFRYSAGSAADPQHRKPNWNRSFELEANGPRGAVLLLHGMSDSPYSLRALGEALNQRGYLVLGLRLPGHGTAPSGLTGVSWRDMAAATGLAMHHLAERVGDKPIHIVGYSTGAPLALDFALNVLDGNVSPTPASLVLISPAIGISPAAALATWKRRLSLLPGLGGLAWLQIEPEFDPYKYNSFATNAGEQVHRLTRSVARRIAAHAKSDAAGNLPPILVLKSTVDATVSTDAVVNRLLKHLAPERHELVLFDVNRFAMKSTLLVEDPGPLTRRLMDDKTLPFAVTLISNESPQTADVVARHKAPFSGEESALEPLDLAWPSGVISLSHVALPFPPDDPLYGQRPPGNDDVLFLGQMAIQGERGLLKLSSDWLLRLRHNPFYPYLERRVLEWVAAPGPATVAAGRTMD
jgi:alpha-beta hydrolase superfamily lysophospholipase